MRIVEFGLGKDCGRYGGIGVDFGHVFKVYYRLMDEILNQQQKSDILKMDIEGERLKHLKRFLPNSPILLTQL